MTDPLQQRVNQVGILIIAAGKGRRFAQAGGKTDKLQARFADAAGTVRTVFAHTLQAALLSKLPVCVVTRPAQRAIYLHCQQREIPVVLVENSRMGESIAAGVRYTAGWRGWLIHPGDMPFISAATLRAVAGKVVDNGIVRPCYRGTPGHPVGFGRAAFEALCALNTEQGARSLLTQFPLCTFEQHDEAILRDIDLPSQLPIGG